MKKDLAGYSMILYAVACLAGTAMGAALIGYVRLDLGPLLLIALGISVSDGSRSATKWSIAAMAFYACSALAVPFVDSVSGRIVGRAQRPWVVAFATVYAAWGLATIVDLARRLKDPDSRSLFLSKAVVWLVFAAGLGIAIGSAHSLSKAPRPTGYTITYQGDRFGTSWGEMRAEVAVARKEAEATRTVVLVYPSRTSDLRRPAISGSSEGLFELVGETYTTRDMPDGTVIYYDLTTDRLEVLADDADARWFEDNEHLRSHLVRMLSVVHTRPEPESPADPRDPRPPGESPEHGRVPGRAGDPSGRAGAPGGL